MKSLIAVVVLVAGTAVRARADKPPADLVSHLTAAVRSVCPGAKITVSDQFRATFGTMIFTLHGRSMTGEISKTTYKEEGPNYKGFVLTVSLEKSRYNRQAVVPQELLGPYYPTFLNAPTTADGRGYYMVQFSYGGRLDPKVKQAILAALPKGASRR